MFPYSQMDLIDGILIDFDAKNEKLLHSPTYVTSLTSSRDNFVWLHFQQV